MGAPSATPDLATGQERDTPGSMVGRMTLILDAFEGRSAQLSLEEVARRTHLPRSTAHRILDQLVRLSWLERSAFGYNLGKRALGFGDREGSYAAIREASAPLLHELQMKTGMVVHLAVLDDANVYYLDKIGGRFATMVPSRVGGRVPAHSTALGKSILAWREPEQVDRQVGGAIDRLTNRTIGDLDTLHRELDRIRRRKGLAFERGECCSGICCVAAAIRGPEGPLAAISLVGDGQASLEKVAPLVVDAARQASLKLFPQQSAQQASGQLGASEGGWSSDAMDRLLAAGRPGVWL